MMNALVKKNPVLIYLDFFLSFAFLWNIEYFMNILFYLCKKKKKTSEKFKG